MKLAIVITALALLAGCSSDAASPAGTAGVADTVPTTAAGAAPSTPAASSTSTAVTSAPTTTGAGAPGSVGAIGSPVQLEGLAVTVESMTAGGDEGGPWVEVKIHSQNTTSTDVGFVDFAIFCDGNKDGGGWQAQSTYPQDSGVPAQSTVEGVLNLMIPGDTRISGTARPACATPAYVVANNGTAGVVWPIDDALVTAMNTPAVSP